MSRAALTAGLLALVMIAASAAHATTVLEKGQVERFSVVQNGPEGMQAVSVQVACALSYDNRVRSGEETIILAPGQKTSLQVTPELGEEIACQN